MDAGYNNNMTTSNITTANPNVEDIFGKMGSGLISLPTYYNCLKVVLGLCLSNTVLGIVTNFLCIRTFFRIGIKDSVTMVFFIQAVLDFCHLILAFAQVTLSYVEVVAFQYDIWFEVQPEIMKNLVTFFIRAFVESNYIVTTFLAIQRCLCVIMPLHFKGIFTRRRTLLILAPGCLISFAVFAAMGLNHRWEKTIVPPENLTRYVIIFGNNNGTWSNMVYIIYGIIINTTSQVVVTICVIFMSRALAKSVRFRRRAAATAVTTTTTTAATATSATSATGRGGQLKETEKDFGADGSSSKKVASSSTNVVSDTKEFRVITQISLICTVYLICNTPRMGIAYSTLVEDRLTLFGAYRLTHLLMWQITMLFEQIGSSLNFFIYYKFNTMFRKSCFKSAKMENKEQH